MNLILKILEKLTNVLVPASNNKISASFDALRKIIGKDSTMYSVGYSMIGLDRL